MIRIITTFNDSLYEASGRALLESLRHFMPKAELLVYTEGTLAQLDAATVPVTELPEFNQVAAQNRDIIDTDANILQPYNRRWFGWFRKVVAEHDALVRRPFAGYTVFLDADVRVMQAFTPALLAEHLRRPVGVFRGNRVAIESGVIFFDGRTAGAAEFTRQFLAQYLGGGFRRLQFWGDGEVMTHCASLHPELVQDMAAGCVAVTHTNSNGHTTTGQILPQTLWGRYFEHDKGLHWRKGVVSAPHAREPESARGPSP